MGIFMATNDLSRIIYYLKPEKTYFFDIALSGHSITFQALDETWTFEQISKSGWHFEPISNKEFEEYVKPIKGIIDYDLLKLRKRKLQSGLNDFTDFDILDER